MGKLIIFAAALLVSALIALVCYAIYGGLKPCTNPVTIKTIHYPQMTVGRFVGKVYIPVIIPAHDETVYMCSEGYTVQR